ncbi:IS5 family transposase [Acetobacter sp. TBRC 12305]|uniref:IS5 family transposase n=1 Tax=Acetobacter garciniae TaxID=2817435 RepID=A0A939HLK8_9PROT|nr:IS5 family transposase [Acetobacter garciniae]MBX0346461.1 IS5 family transposase [Acetobacter garciniae]
MGRTKGGLNSKLHAVCDGQGRPIRLHLTAGQVSDFKGADVLLAHLPVGTEEVIGDRGYDSNRIRRYLVERNITACIPPRKNRKSKPSYNWHLYKKRHFIENMFAKLKDRRRVTNCSWKRCCIAIAGVFPRVISQPVSGTGKTCIAVCAAGAKVVLSKGFSCFWRQITTMNT